jgi:hypothetical protein
MAKHQKSKEWYTCDVCGEHCEPVGIIEIPFAYSKEGGTIMPEELVRVMIRLTSEQHEWLRKYCFDNRISQAEVLRQALELYRQELAKEQRKG